MRRAGRVVGEMLATCRDAARPGVTTGELDRLARDVIERRGVRSNFLNYHGFPGVICASPNNVVVHGIPGAHRLKEGDILSIDCGAIYEGWHADAARTFPIGGVSAAARRLIEVTAESLQAGIEQLVEGNRVNDIGRAVQKVVEGAGYSVVREYVGHGIGQALHEEPKVPNFEQSRQGIRLRPGIVLAVEPMVNLGRPETEMEDDGWTVVTADGTLSAHFENTIALTDDGPEVLTVLP